MGSTLGVIEVSVETNDRRNGGKPDAHEEQHGGICPKSLETPGSSKSVAYVQ